jgi:hypothetical protein
MMPVVFAWIAAMARAIPDAQFSPVGEEQNRYLVRIMQWPVSIMAVAWGTGLVRPDCVEAVRNLLADRHRVFDQRVRDIAHHRRVLGTGRGCPDSLMPTRGRCFVCGGAVAVEPNGRPEPHSGPVASECPGMQALVNYVSAVEMNILALPIAAEHYSVL